MRFFSNFLKRIKDKIRFEIMTKKEYELFLRKKSMGHKPSSFKTNLSMSSRNSNNSSSIHHEINPATGLPMVGGVDAGGNPYGFDSSSSFDHSFQDLGNSYHNDFHHN